MTAEPRPQSPPSIADLLAAAEPTGQRPLGELIERLSAGGLLRGARDAGRAIGPAALAGIPIAAIADDSRSVRVGSLFAAVPGLHVDGHDYVAAAAGSGAAVALVERAIADVALPQLVVERAPAALADAAAWWHGDPSLELGIVGITGTDGKTTTSFLAAAALEAAGLSQGLIGTVATRIGTVHEANPEHTTTPGALLLQRTLRAMAANGNAVAVVETTSHGLAAERVRGIAYDIAIVTNLTHEHLDFHGTWERYRDAKLSLFERLAVGPANPAKEIRGRRWPKAAIVNGDDPNASAFIGVAQEAGARIVTYGTDGTADVRATRVEEDAKRLRIAYDAPAGSAVIDLRLAGRFNVHNALAVVALGEVLDLDPAAVRAGLEGVLGVPGRMERLDAGQPFGVVIDYAHSPASLEKVLGLLAPLAAARGGDVIVVFGSAGERDTDKRPMMGRIAAELARIVVVTDEDPRGEDSGAILDDIARGAEHGGKRRDRDLLLIPDRPAAIAAAFERARAGDIVLLAGKGHERSIIGPDGPRPYDEATTARAALAGLGFVGPAGH
ncbi:MAG: UDP-N-acetylmuramoyl-L-alanyl-D-glutamate--2,6-diaminopimelate ligase [Chloroflexota bacterium]|jgi:UDP-N-acetylmuramoyl-L-alanyl-D-glutamate--2,6-diaminopimelate ligase|nr:UDP-N-acetylmuramoyl-L-alanyl-D-glutamate--2,6-diaminopimelate ligase [Chloroflexota bacterium]